jgi:hypothetical protein
MTDDQSIIGAICRLASSYPVARAQAAAKPKMVRKRGCSTGTNKKTTDVPHNVKAFL